MPSSIVSPFPVFNDLDGTPLENGYIYIGQSNLNPETAPVNVFWDAARTIPAAQPIRTIGGFPSRNGSPSNVYVENDTYSITVRNSRRVFVYSAFDQTDAPSSVFDISTQVITATAGQTTFTLTTFTYLPGTDTLQVYRNGLRLTSGTDYLESSTSTVTLTTPAAAEDEFLFQGGAVITGNSTPGTSVSFIQAGTGAVTRNMQDKARESVSVKDFGAVGDGTTSDTSAFQTADSAGNLEIPAGIYRFSSNLTMNSTLQFMPGAKLLADSGVTITLNEKPVADASQIIFDGAGTYAFGGDISKWDAASPRWFGASGSATTTLATTTASNPVVTLSSAADFSNGEQIAIEHAGAASSLTTPINLSVSATGLNRQGPTGSTTYSYKVAAVDENGAISAASAAVTITNGNATLGTISSSIRGLAFNKIQWETSATGAALWRSKSGGAYQLIGVFGLGQSDSIANGCLDAGLPEITIPWIPATPPSTALAGRLVTRIISGEGTTSLTLQNAPQTSGASLLARHDDTVPLGTLATLVKNISIPTGTYNVSSLQIPNTVSSISGNGYGSKIYGWGARSAVVNVQCSAGFSASALKVDSTAWHNQIGLQLNNGVNCKVSDCSTSGNLPIFLVSCSHSFVNNNFLENWIDSGIFDLFGNANTIQNNFVNPGCNAIPQNAAAIHAYSTNSDIISGNRTLGSCVYSIKVEAGNQNVISENWAYNTWAENYHLTGSSSGNRITGNTMYGGPLMMDYGISISNDDRPNVVMHANEVTNNFIYQCGTAAIAVVEFGGTNPNINYTTIKGNTVHGANQNAQPNMPEILVNGSHVSNTYVSDHHTFSYANIDYVVKESNAVYGLPNNTQVGTIFGDGGSTGLTLLTGTGSSKLLGGTTGK